MADPTRGYVELLKLVPPEYQQKAQELLSALQFKAGLYTLPVYASNTLAAADLAVGSLYRNGDNVCVVH